MASQLDKALEDVIKENKSSSRRGRSDQFSKRPSDRPSPGGIRKRSGGPRNNGGGGGPIASRIVRTVQPRGFSGGSRSEGRGNVDKQWTHDKFDDRNYGGFGGGGRSSLAARLGGRTGSSGGGRQNDGGEITIENLHYNVVEKDLQDLFEMVGRVEKTRIIFDRSGRSTGTAQIRFVRRADAEAAVEKYNNVELDGQAMKIEIAADRRGGRSTGGTFANGRGRRSGGRDRRSNNDDSKKGRNETDLDDEMDAYMKSSTTGNGGDDNQMALD
ncbi:hypothetical protein BDB00DRAFT_874332 [Zychaea mexicana]|uniref:uncharacterized protein n=1 Tax=Zychaea mexicana TaxID=64656 RepID=UPI0022FE1F8A|nr:uncharacterized protein BDB00DRAFT_874332 [Zychaea mexicana]KAI9491438.1 hypothetical protein BDB00DRAFT_874332 [Zychaea mexicana]